MTSVAGLLLASSLVLAAQGASKPSTVECKLGNPGYAGACVERVTPDKGQTPLKACQAVLACLNNPQCIKTYCGATTVRGGWTLDSPKPEPASKPKP